MTNRLLPVLILLTAFAAAASVLGLQFVIPEYAHTTFFLVGLAMLLLLIAGTLWVILTGGRRLQSALGPQGIQIQLPWGGKQIPYADIERIELSSKNPSVMRVGGIGAPGFNVGEFNYQNIPLTCYANHFEQLVLVKARDRIYGITPEQPEAFIADCERRMTESAGQASPVIQTGGGGRVWLWLLVALNLAALGAALMNASATALSLIPVVIIGVIQLALIPYSVSLSKRNPFAGLFTLAVVMAVSMVFLGVAFDLSS